MTAALTVPMASTRSADPIAQDLRWLLQRDYEGDLGVRSSLALQIETIQLGGRRNSTSRAVLDLSDTLIRAASRLRRLEARWRALDEESQNVLWCVYGLPKRRLPEYGELGPLVLYRARSFGDYRAVRGNRELLEWLSSLRGGKNHQLFERIRDDARACLEDARRAWQDTWSVTRSRRWRKA